MHLGLQLYTLREALAADPRATLRQVAAAGYTHVELADAEQLPTLRPLCEELGLRIRGSFYNFGLVTGDVARVTAALPEMVPRRSFGATVELAAAADLTYLVFGYLLPFQRATVSDYQRLCERLNRAAETVRAAGLQQVYHHHSFEFQTLDRDGTRGWDILLRELDPALVSFEVDVFWAALGGEDPAALLRDHAERVTLAHLKDVAPEAATPQYDETAVAPEAFRAVGEGRLYWPAILAALREAEVDYVAVEQDLGEAREAGMARSAAFLRKHL